MDKQVTSQDERQSNLRTSPLSKGLIFLSVMTFVAGGHSRGVCAEFPH